MFTIFREASDIWRELWGRVWHGWGWRGLASRCADSKLSWGKKLDGLIRSYLEGCCSPFLFSLATMSPAFLQLKLHALELHFVSWLSYSENPQLLSVLSIPCLLFCEKVSVCEFYLTCIKVHATVRGCEWLSATWIWNTETCCQLDLQLSVKVQF